MVFFLCCNCLWVHLVGPTGYRGRLGMIVDLPLVFPLCPSFVRLFLLLGICPISL
ncbi:hypothetical protein Hanom_Chr08g00684391 [Helianthus anomalus]